MKDCSHLVRTSQGAQKKFLQAFVLSLLRQDNPSIEGREPNDRQHPLRQVNRSKILPNFQLPKWP